MDDTRCGDEPVATRGPGAVTSGPPIRDLWWRLALSPVFGVGLPLVTGLVTPARHDRRSLLLSFALFTLVAFLVWEGNRRLHYRLSRREDWLRRPLHRVAVLLAVIVGFTLPVSTGLLLAWQALFDDPGVGPHALPVTVVAIVSLVAVITNVYESVFVLREWETDRVRAAEAETARAAATLSHLSRAIGPHFLFNNLNALQHLVESRDPHAARFIEALSESYRYVLHSHERALVPLDEELRALELQRVLVSRRYGNHVQTQVAFTEAEAARWAVPPVSLVELLLNAVKHSQVDAAHPMVLQLTIEGDRLYVANDVTARVTPVASTGTGLQHLADRARLCAGRPVSWSCAAGRFVVQVPLVAR